MPKNVLVVEPDDSLRRDVAEALAQSQIEVREAISGMEALDAARMRQPDLLLTEMLLPDVTGLGLCRMVREQSELTQLPIVLTTRYAAEIDRVLAFEAGVDDCVPKPYSLKELCARIRAILRRPPRAGQGPSDNEMTAPVDSSVPDSVRAISERLVDATPRELQILAELARREGRVVSRKELLDRVWENDARCAPRTVDAHVKSLRRKLGTDRACIQTVRGVGYRFELRTVL